MTSQPTCEQRIENQQEGRLRDINALLAVAQAFDAESMATALEEATGAADALEESGWAKDDALARPSEAAEAARERLWELPLGITTHAVYRIDLSTGGPGDWLEIQVDEDRQIARAEYHFNDWFDHAARTLEGDDLATAEAFAREVVPALTE